MRVVFMGTPQAAVPSLERLVTDGYKVAGVYTQPDRTAGRGRFLAFSPVKQAAMQWGLRVLQPENFREGEDIKKLADLKPEVIVICAYGQILPQSVLDIPPYQCINIHFSLLPRHRGASPVAAAILAGDEFSGVSIQLVRKKLDTGPILIAGVVPVASQDTTGSLTGKLSLAGSGLLLEALSGWLRNEITPRTQDESRATYFRQIKKEEGEIDWSLPAWEIGRKVRAYYPWPGCFTRWKGKNLRIIRATVLPGESSDGAGKVVTLPGQEAGLGICTGEGVLAVTSLQLEGKRVMTASEFVRGQRDFIGSVLPG
ncbi:MAG TPA: methionyl-tRNA formyltransferase [Dehalococcoidia bacterium]|nr:methionyl-tRNA formyltransferase [Dehalococcoidia bacterium]